MFKLLTYIVTSTLLFSLIIANVLISGSLSTVGEELKQLEQQKEQLLKHNQQLEAIVLDNSSLTKLQLKADALGFVKPDNVRVLESPKTTVALGL